MKILYVVSNPLLTSRLALDEEIRKVQAEITAASLRDEITFSAILAARPTDFIRALNRERPDVLHFSGHGSQDGELIFSSDTGEPHPIDPRDLVELLGALERPPRLVVLNSCFSFKQAESIATVVDVVIGLPDEIDDHTAATFAAELYSALGEGVNVFNSYRLAIIGTKLLDKDSWSQGTPMIMSKRGTDTSKVLVVDPIKQLNLFENKEKTFFDNRYDGREFFMSKFAAFCEARERVAIVFFDIQGMKSINTIHSRRIGDRVIAETLMEIEDKSNSAVAAGICGDDTFFCVYESDNRSDVIRLARQMIVDIETHDWGRIALGLWVRVEGGFAIWQKGQETPAELVVRSAVGLKTAQVERTTFTEGTRQNAQTYLNRLLRNGRELSREIMSDLFS